MVQHNNIKAIWLSVLSMVFSFVSNNLNNVVGSILNKYIFFVCLLEWLKYFWIKFHLAKFYSWDGILTYKSLNII